MIHVPDHFSREESLRLFKKLLLPRLIEEKMITVLRQGRISKWFSGIGQEAIAVGVAEALDNRDFILPMHRNLGVFTTRGLPLYRLICQWLGKPDGFTRGRDRSFHFGSPEYHIVGMISHLGANLPVADGLALALKLRQEQQVALAFCGEGATSEGDFHEALNLAAVWKLPAIFLIENNGYGLSTPVEEQYACRDLVERASGYNLKGFKIDGNNIFEVVQTVQIAREHALHHSPVLIEAKTFRMKGHEEASGTFYIPDEKFDQWQQKDPLRRMETTLFEKKWLKKEDIPGIKTELLSPFEEALEKALNAPEPVFDAEKEQNSIFAPLPAIPSQTKMKPVKQKRFIDAVRDALLQAFREDKELVMLGQDIAEYGGVFKVTEGFWKEFGKERIRNTPIIESGAIGTAVGLALQGFRPVVEMQFADFISCGFNQIINNLAKGYYRWMPPLNVTIRCPHGAGVGAGPFHSQSPEGWFMQHAGLKIMVPATVRDAQDMLYSALFDSNPVLVFEHKKLYRSLKETVPEAARRVNTACAAVRKEGRDASVITYGLGVHWATAMADKLRKKGLEIEVVDLRSLIPIDFDAIATSIKKTNRVLLLQEPSLTLGPVSEIASWISEHCFEYLDAPIMRCASLDTPVPFHKNLEEGYLAVSRLEDKMQRLLRY